MPPRRSDLGVFWTSSDRAVKLYHGDCINVMKKLIPAGNVDLVFADPPFNVGLDYDTYHDKMTKADYLDWTYQWLVTCNRVMSPTASIYVAIGVPLQAEVKSLMEAAGLYWRDTIVWHYTFGPRQEKKWTPSWVAIHYATKDRRNWTWNADAVKVPSARQLKYNDRRAVPNGKLPDNVWVLMPTEYGDCFQEGANAILESRVCGTFKERTPHPCQMPVPVLERIIAASSNQGDLVLDPFIGSGTTAVASCILGRQCVGIDLSANYLSECVIPRIEQLERVSNER